MSILVILFGTMYYTWVKSRESAQPPRPSPSTNARQDDLEAGTGPGFTSKEDLDGVPSVQTVDWQEKKQGTD